MATAVIATRPTSVWNVPEFARTSISNHPTHRITFRHPAYPEGCNVLLTLRAYDHPTGGLHHETARIACGIVAGNAWDGYFSETAGGQPLCLGVDAILSVGKTYFFHVPHPATEGEENISSPYKYPVYPSFQHWRFPHGNLPPSWTKQPTTPSNSLAFPDPLALAATVIQRDGSCRMSNHRDLMQCAHICPRQEIDWFSSNDMAQYNLNGSLPGTLLTDDSSNALALRADLHSAFDKGMFVFVPKPISSPSSFVTHALQQTSEIGPLFHNGTLLPVQGVQPEFLLARFAWAIFPFLAPFLSVGVERYLLLVKDQASKPEAVPGDDCRRLAGDQGRSSKSRSGSPRKRRAADIPLESVEGISSESEDIGFFSSFSSGSPSFKYRRTSSSNRC
jgi:hypothetical protein